MLYIAINEIFKNHSSRQNEVKGDTTNRHLRETGIHHTKPRTAKR